MNARPLTVEDALQAVLTRASRLSSRPIGLADALGLTLDEDLAAETDSPPFDKALVDGFAIRAADLTEANERTFNLVGELMAGDWPDRPLESGQTVAIMTGAPLPPGSDSVVMVETAQRDGLKVRLRGPILPGSHRLQRGREWKAGEVILKRGEPLDPIRLGLAASLGRASVSAVARPRVTVVPTGDELVDPGQSPAPGQIRNSNGVLLSSLLRSLGAEARAEPIVRDADDALKAAFSRLLGSGPDSVDVLVVSGGVSAGKLDLVPSALEASGAEPVFHKVQVRPGKPLWFGVGPDRPNRPRALIFGLPGNPVSGVVSILLFVKPALDTLSGRSPHVGPLAQYPLASSFPHRGDRPTYHPASLAGSPLQIDLRLWAGSPDLRALAGLDGFAVFPAGDHTYESGDPVEFLPWPARTP
jgi:molybdopterin molybdotransferase